MPWFLTSKHSRLGAVAAASILTGALTGATAITAVAVTMTSASDAVTARTAHGDAMSAAQQLIGFDRVRFSLGERQQANDVAAAKASPEQIAQQMLNGYGWSSDQMSCLYLLWYHESGWDPSAQNAGSGAYGIPQALPGSQMASAGSDWQTNPATQIKWGLTYIQGRYGSPCGAWAHEQASNWY